MKKALKSVSLPFPLSENEKLKKAKSILDDVLKPMLAAENADEIDELLTDELLDDIVDLFYDESLVKEQAESLSEAMVKKLEAQCAVLELENQALQAKIQKSERKNRKKNKSGKKKRSRKATKMEKGSDMEIDDNDNSGKTSAKTEKITEEMEERSASPTLHQFLNDTEMDSDNENDDEMPDLVPNSPEGTKCESPAHDANDTTPNLIPNEHPKNESSDSEADISYRRSVRKKRCSNCDYSTVSEANLINHQKLFHPKRARRTRGSNK